MFFDETENKMKLNYLTHILPKILGGFVLSSTTGSKFLSKFRSLTCIFKHATTTSSNDILVSQIAANYKHHELNSFTDLLEKPQTQATELLLSGICVFREQEGNQTPYQNITTKKNMTHGKSKLFSFS